jgi:dipeptidyl aminopeptidase/acylaminoacyl peptidase
VLSKSTSQIGQSGFEVTVKQGLNQPPLLVAANKHTSRVIWDPNPQLKNIQLTKATAYTWKDKDGRDWRGGLYLPPNYKAGQRYPLVIQTHGFTESAFIPSGLFPPFAARELAAAGIAVLQVADVESCRPVMPSSEERCAASGYEAAVNRLASEGLVDPDKLGIIGFSYTGVYVMETLTFGSLHFKAASITDVTLDDYFQYMIAVDNRGDILLHLFDSMNGPPFGMGLQQWLKRSPGFNLDKVTAPLLIVGEGPNSVLGMWGTYAGLRYLQKPVDLIMLNTDEHVLTNPAVRMVSQSGTVDWFRFWLQGYEDPDPAKRAQYKRWEELRKLQEAEKT